MVEFELIDENTERVVYYYYPERKKANYGVIILNKNDNSMYVETMAKGDSKRDIPKEEINMLIDSINETGKKVEYVEEDLKNQYHYANHAMNEIRKHISKDSYPKNGGQVWM